MPSENVALGVFEEVLVDLLQYERLFDDHAAVVFDHESGEFRAVN